MPSLTVIVTAGNDTQGLKYTLEGLVEQTVEDFTVLIVDNGCDENARSMIDSYCKEYVGFEKITIPASSVPAARNAGAAAANSDYLWFIDNCDYISPESVESVLTAASETKADIICPRYYESGNNEPLYNHWADLLATVPSVDKFDRALLNTMDADGRVFSRRFFDQGLTYTDTPLLYNMQFLADCLYKYNATVTGVAGAIYDKKNGVFFDDYLPGTEPCQETLDYYSSVFEKTLAVIAELIKKETGAAEGDEFTIQEFLTVYFGALVSYFYRRFWYLNNDEIIALKDKFEAISSHLTEDRKNKFNEANADIRFPGMYMSREDAAKLPFFSLLLDFSAVDNVPDFIRVLYINEFPFFEIFIKESQSNCIPQRFASCENIHIVPDKGFFSVSRSKAKGIPINVKDPTPLDPRILSQLSLSKAPRTALQYMFSAKRKKFAAKTYLKNKGMQLQ